MRSNGKLEGRANVVLGIEAIKPSDQACGLRATK